MKMLINANFDQKLVMKIALFHDILPSPAADIYLFPVCYFLPENFSDVRREVPDKI